MYACLSYWIVSFSGLEYLSDSVTLVLSIISEAYTLKYDLFIHKDYSYFKKCIECSAKSILLLIEIGFFCEKGKHMCLHLSVSEKVTKRNG